MSERLDEQIRVLFAELDEVAPEAPPMPRVPLTPEPKPVWSRILVPASGVAVLILALGAVGQLVFFSGSDSSADEASTATSSAEAAAAETPGPEAGTRPSGPVLALATLNLSCSRFVRESEVAVPLLPDFSQGFLDALAGLDPPVGALVDSIVAVGGELADPGFDPTASAAEDIKILVSDGASGPAGTAEETFNIVVVGLGQLGVDLEDYGALDCVGLESGLP